MFSLEEVCLIINENFEEFNIDSLKEAFNSSKDNEELKEKLYILLDKKEKLKNRYIDKKDKDPNEKLIPSPNEKDEKESQKKKLKNRLKIKD